jgi:hypothetical protein
MAIRDSKAALREIAALLDVSTPAAREFCRAVQSETGDSPSYREIADVLKTDPALSPSAVAGALDARQPQEP